MNRQIKCPMCSAGIATVIITKDCDHCLGTGKEPGSDAICLAFGCRGGKVEYKERRYCNYCAGQGYLDN